MVDWTQELLGGAGVPDAQQAPQAKPPDVTPPVAPTSGSAGRFAVPQLAPSTDWTSELLGQSSVPKAEPQQPDDRSFGRKAYDLVAGRQDPAYAGIKSIDEELMAEGGSSVTPELRQLRASLPFAVTDESYGQVAKNALGQRFIRNEKDKFGHDVVVYRGADNSEKKAYVNKPGLDTEDVSRGMVAAVPYVLAGGPMGAALKGASTGLRVGGQFFGGGLTSLFGDAASMPFGATPDVKEALVRAGTIGIFGGATEALAGPLSNLWRRFVTIPGLFNKEAGKLTSKGAEAATKLGIDPDILSEDIAKKFAELYAKSRGTAADELGAKVSTQTLGIPSTLGQRTKDAERLLQEKAMRYGVYGQNAKEIMQGFDKQQAQAIKDAALGRYNPTGPGTAEIQPGIATALTPRRTVDELNPVDLGQSIRTGLNEARSAAKAGERQAWEAVPDLLPRPEALELLPEAIGGSLGAMRPDKEITPVAYRMAEMLDGYMAGKPMQGELKVLGNTSGITTIDEMRRRLLSASRAAGNDSDRAMAGRLYQGFNDWIDTAAERALLTGKPEAAAALRSARQVSREVKDLFMPTDAGGKRTAGARILEDVMQKSDSAEGIVSGLFGGGPSANIKDGTIEALLRMKTILTNPKFQEQDLVRQSWNDVRASYWMRLVMDKKGEMFTPGVMLNNIKTALSNQKSVMTTLYGRGELGRIGMMVKALETVSYKDPNPSGSGVAVASMARQFFKTVFEAFGGKSRPVQMALEMSGLGRAYGTAAAKSATEQGVKASQPNLGPLGTVAGSVFNDVNQ